MMFKAMTLGLAVAATAMSPEWTAVLRPTDEKGPKGTARAQVAETTTRVTIELSGAKPGSRLPWHIHSGDCNGRGSIWGEPSMYPPLRIGQEGAVTGAVTLPVVLPSNGEYAVTVHKSADDMAPVACGALLQAPMPEPMPAQRKP